MISLNKIFHGGMYSQRDRLYYKYATNIPQDINIISNNTDHKYTTNILQDYKNDLIELIKAKEDILNIIKEHKDVIYSKDTTNIIEVVAPKGISIKKFETSARATSVRIYDETLEKWKEFCGENKNHSNQDLLSMALEEYIEKYCK